MYRRPKFLQLLLEIREQMSRDIDYDVDLFVETVRSGKIVLKDTNVGAEQSKKNRKVKKAK